MQAYFRINSEKAGQFERTLIIADEGADVTYIEGCTAPIYMSSSLHSAVVELVAHKNAHIRYVTIQNWSKNVYNLVTQRAFAYENAHVEWIDGKYRQQAEHEVSERIPERKRSTGRDNVDCCCRTGPGAGLRWKDIPPCT